MRLRELRESKGWTQEDLAAESDILQVTISYLETADEPNPTWRVLSALCRALKCRPEQLMADTREKVGR